MLLKIVPSCLNTRGHAISQKMSTLSAGTKQRIDADGFAVIAGVLGYREMDTLKGDMGSRTRRQIPTPCVRRALLFHFVILFTPLAE